MKVSIITVTYNSSRSLPRTLASVEAQTHTDIEHILVDGASTDDTMRLIRAYADKHPGVRYLSEPDRGIYDAINKGLRLATGDIIGILNSDDVLQDNCVLADIVRTMEQEHSSICYGDLTYCRPSGSVLRHWCSGVFTPRRLHLGWMPPHPTFYCARDVYEREGEYDDWFRISADYDFMLRALRSGYRVSYIPRVLVSMTTGGASNRNVRALLSKSQEDILAMRKNNMRCALGTLLCKNIRKISQFWR